MTTACHDIDFFDIPTTSGVERSGSISGKIENQDGSIMFFARYRTINKRRSTVAVKANSAHIKVPLTFKSAMWMGIGFVAIALGGAWAMYTHLDNKLETYRSGTETKIESSRSSIESKVDALGNETRSHFDSARLEVKGDNDAIKSQLQTISNNLAELNGKLSKDK